MGNLNPLGLTRRSFVAVSSALFVVAALPQKIWAAALRPETAFQATTLEATFEALGGAPTVSDGIVFSTPDIAENGAVVPLGASTTLAGVKHMLVLVEKNPSALIAMFHVSDVVDANFLTRAKMGQSSDVYAVAIMADGKALFAKKEVKVTLGGCGG